ncbi:MAG: homoserine O-acetyltransferase [Verrucomicrobiota bacterium]
MAAPTTTTRYFNLPKERCPFTLSNGSTLSEITLAYEQYGEINSERDNVILLFHALSGSHHASGHNPDNPPAGDLWTDECWDGWWDAFIGSGKALDTDKFCVLCVNYLGGCYGSTGPASHNPETLKPYGSSFPHITASDVVDSQWELLESLAVKKLHAVVGSSVGGLLALNLATRYPNTVNKVIITGSALQVSPLQKILILEQILAIENDSHFKGGDYYDGEHPDTGLALARMISHKTFVSLRTLESRARRDVVRGGKQLSWHQIESPLESYLLYQGNKFVKRFDANTYLRILEIWQKFDILHQADAQSYEQLFEPCKHQEYLVFTISSDVCFYPDQQSGIVRALKSAGVSNMHLTVHSEKGHDSFLLEPELYTPHLNYMLSGTGRD